MAIQFLRQVEIDGTITATINADANDGYDGILVSTSGLIERRTKAQILADIGAGSMNSFVVSADTNSATTTISNGETLSLVGGTGISTVSNPDGTITITSSASGYSGWDLSGDSGTDQTIASGNVAKFAGGTKLSTATSATDTLTIDHDLQSQTNTTASASLVSGGTFTALAGNVSVDTTGHLTGQVLTTFTLPTSDVYTGWKLDGDSSGSSVNVSSGDTVDFIGSTGISCVAASGDTLTITNDLPFNSLTLDSTSGTSSTISNNGTIDIAAGTSISATGDGAGKVTIAYTGGTGSMSSWTLDGDSGTSQTISDGNSVTIAGGTNITTVASATDTVTVNLDNSITLSGSVTADSADLQTLVVDGATTQTGILTMGAAIAMASNKITALGNGTDSTDAVNLGQVETLVAGQSLFKGSYDASSEPGTPAISGASNIANSVGDFYAVTVGGAFFTFTTEPGDLIFINNDIAANSDPNVSNFTVVQSGQSIASAGATDGAATKGVAGFDSANFVVSASGWVQMKASGVTANQYGSASIVPVVTVDADGFVTDAVDTTIDITASQVSDFCTAVETCVSSNLTYAESIGDGTAVSYVVTHSLGTRDVQVQLYDNSTFDTVYAEVVRTDADKITITTTSAITTNGVRVLISKAV